jgi:glutamate racemase
VRHFARQLGWSLVKDFDVKLVVVACNTASAAALDELEAELPVPVVGVIEPGARSLVQATRSGQVGVIGTVGTIGSGAYQRAVAATGAEVTLTGAACPGFVEFVERGETHGEQVTILAERLLAPLRDAGVDTLLLGCTHYPYLARVISDVVGPDVVLVSSADETAFAVRRLLDEVGLRRAPGGGPAEHRFFSSGDVSWFADLGSRLLGPELAHATHWHPDLAAAVPDAASHRDPQE